MLFHDYYIPGLLHMQVPPQLFDSPLSASVSDLDSEFPRLPNFAQNPRFCESSPQASLQHLPEFQSFPRQVVRAQLSIFGQLRLHDEAVSHLLLKVWPEKVDYNW